MYSPCFIGLVPPGVLGLIVRSLTLHLPAFSSDLAVEVASRLFNCSRDVDVWTFRLTISDYECNVLSRLCEAAERYGLLVHIGEASLYERRCGVSFLNDGGCSRFFAVDVCFDEGCVAGRLESLWSRGSLDVYTRYAVLIGGYVATPYFPATYFRGDELILGVALRYADAFPKIARGEYKGFIEWVEKVISMANRVARCIGAKSVYVDLSLSPWMEESVAKALERVSGTVFGSVGSLAAVKQANDIITRVAEALEARGVDIGGFNEVMLAVAEDRYLDELVARGYIRLRDLIAYTTVCVAGLDMVAVPKDLVDPRRLAADLWTSYLVRRKPMGARIIPVDEKPGSTVTLERFGKTHVVTP